MRLTAVFEDAAALFGWVMAPMLSERSPVNREWNHGKRCNALANRSLSLVRSPREPRPDTCPERG